MYVFFFSFFCVIFMCFFFLLLFIYSFVSNSLLEAHFECINSNVCICVVCTGFVLIHFYNLERFAVGSVRYVDNGIVVYPIRSDTIAESFFSYFFFVIFYFLLNFASFFFVFNFLCFFFSFLIVFVACIC